MACTRRIDCNLTSQRIESLITRPIREHYRGQKTFSDIDLAETKNEQKDKKTPNKFHLDKQQDPNIAKFRAREFVFNKTRIEKKKPPMLNAGQIQLEISEIF